MLIDTHCHLDHERFDEDRAEALQRAWAAGLTGIVVPGIGPSNWESLLKLPSQDRRLQVGLGIHPQLLPRMAVEDDEQHLDTLDQLLSRGGAIAVGECGLDGPSSEGAPMERQLRVLERHFDLARKHSLPLLVHVFKAHDAAVELFKRLAWPERGVLMHSYSGGHELVKFYAERGCHFSLAGPVSYDNARKPVAAVRAIAKDRLMAETDAPDQTPTPHRGKRSEPAFVREVVDAMAVALGEPASTVAQRTTENARRFFNGAFDLR